MEVDAQSSALDRQAAVWVHLLQCSQVRRSDRRVNIEWDRNWFYLPDFLTHLPFRMQDIYGLEFVVHPVHRALFVADFIYRSSRWIELARKTTKIFQVTTTTRRRTAMIQSKMNGPLAYQQWLKQKLQLDTTMHCQKRRKCYHPTVGSHYYFADPDLLEICDLAAFLDFSPRTLQRKKSNQWKPPNNPIWVYTMYDEDNYNLIGIARTVNNERCWWSTG